MSGPRHSREPNAGYVAAAAVLVLSGAFVLALGVFGYVRNGLTPHEVIAGCVAIVVALIAGLLFRRERGRQ